MKWYDLLLGCVVTAAICALLFGVPTLAQSPVELQPWIKDGAFQRLRVVGKMQSGRVWCGPANTQTVYLPEKYSCDTCYQITLTEGQEVPPDHAGPPQWGGTTDVLVQTGRTDSSFVILKAASTDSGTVHWITHGK